MAKKNSRNKPKSKPEKIEKQKQEVTAGKKRESELQNLAMEREKEIKNTLETNLAQRFSTKLSTDTANEIAEYLIREGWRRLAVFSNSTSSNPTDTIQTHENEDEHVPSLASAATAPKRDQTAPDFWAQPIRVKPEDLFNVIMWFLKDEQAIRRLSNWITSQTSLEMGVRKDSLRTDGHKERWGITAIEQVLSQGGRLDQLFTFTNSLWTMWPRHAFVELHLGYHEVESRLNDKLTSLNDSEGSSAINSYLQQQSRFGVKTSVRLNPPIGMQESTARDQSREGQSKSVLLHNTVGAAVSIGGPAANRTSHEFANEIWRDLSQKNLYLPYLALKKNERNATMPTSSGFFRITEETSYIHLGENEVYHTDESIDVHKFLDYGLVLIDAREAFAGWHRHHGKLKAVVAGLGVSATRAAASAFGYVMDCLAKDLDDDRIIRKGGIAIAALGVTQRDKIGQTEGAYSVWRFSHGREGVDSWSEQMGWRFINARGENRNLR